jgi:hypothetical protein
MGTIAVLGQKLPQQHGQGLLVEPRFVGQPFFERAHKALGISVGLHRGPHPEQVTDVVFQSQPFFDPRDLLQVKYEMLRRVLVEGQPVGATAATFGFSRVTL